MHTPKGHPTLAAACLTLGLLLLSTRCQAQQDTQVRQERAGAGGCALGGSRPPLADATGLTRQGVHPHLQGFIRISNGRFVDDTCNEFRFAGCAAAVAPARAAPASAAAAAARRR